MSLSRRRRNGSRILTFLWQLSTIGCGKTTSGYSSAPLSETRVMTHLHQSWRRLALSPSVLPLRTCWVTVRLGPRLETWKGLVARSDSMSYYSSPRNCSIMRKRRTRSSLPRKSATLRGRRRDLTSRTRSCLRETTLQLRLQTSRKQSVRATVQSSFRLRSTRAWVRARSQWLACAART